MAQKMDITYIWCRQPFGRKKILPEQTSCPNSSPESASEDLDELFLRLIARFKAHVREVAEAVDLSVLQLIALRHLEHPLPMGKLADILFSDPSVMTAVADALEERGYLERRVSPEDRRVKELVLTGEGQEMQRRVRRMVAKDNPAFSALSKADREEFVRLLELMTRDA